jgi:starch-binding outer membrane protein SusE/F
MVMVINILNYYKMKRNSLIYLIFIGLISLLAGCEKDGTNVVMLKDPIAPTIGTLPSLTLTRAHGKDTLTFVGTAVDPGFQASATYFLEACAHGNNFADAVTIYSGVQDAVIKITVSDLNGIMLKKFAADQVSSVDFRIRSVLTVDAGTGAPGTSTDPLVYSSAATTANVTIYGLPRLDLVGSGITQKIESALGDGSYTGFVKLDATKPFTLNDPDAGKAYGTSGAALAVNGSAFTVTASGWYKLSADTKALTYTLKAYMVGLIGSAAPNGWSAPDSKMDYDNASGLWTVTLDLVVGEVKFRSNDDWNAGINLGLGDATHPQYTLTNLWNDGGSKNIPIAIAGNYTVKLSIGSTAYSCTITKNN